MHTEYMLDTAVSLTMVLAETTGTDTIIYLHGLGLVAQSDGTNEEYFTYDGLGSVRQVVDDTASVLMTQTFDPYGNLYQQAVASSWAGDTSFGYTGEMSDSSSLIFLRARYYNPTHGRFLNMDPSRQEVSLYEYGLSNPILFTDPSGLIPPECIIDPYGDLCERAVDLRPPPAKTCSTAGDPSDPNDVFCEEHGPRIAQAAYEVFLQRPIVERDMTAGSQPGYVVCADVIRIAYGEDSPLTEVLRLYFGEDYNEDAPRNAISIWRALTQLPKYSNWRPWIHKYKEEGHLFVNAVPGDIVFGNFTTDPTGDGSVDYGPGHIGIIVRVDGSVPSMVWLVQASYSGDRVVYENMTDFMKKAGDYIEYGHPHIDSNGNFTGVPQ